MCYFVLWLCKHVLKIYICGLYSKLSNDKLHVLEPTKSTCISGHKMHCYSNRIRDTY